MSGIEYDLDTSGGLMPQVQALIAPPVSEDSTKSKKNEKTVHPYFKRPGKGHNHDLCDACSEGGDLICCDKCPASFHLTCHDPPLDEKDIPSGQWLCHHCRKIWQEYSGGAPQTRNKRSNSSCDRFMMKKSRINNPMNVLVKAASLLNPKQFELPRSMSVNSCLFPGTDKKVYDGPLPARTCFECRKSCRIGPLLACDYCPLLFHLDCLDPPLTALPAGRWMCPNHVEQYLDSKLVTSVSATERIRLWDKFSGPVDQDAVKMEFFRRVHCRNPPFRVKVKLGTRKRVQVPEMVKKHYKKPVALLPSLKDVLRLETVTNRGREYLEYVTALYVAAKRENNLQSIEDDLNEIKNGVVKEEDELTPQSGGGPILNEEIDKELEQLDERLIRLLAFQRIQHLLNSERMKNGLEESVNSKQKIMPLPSELLTPADIERISRVFTSPKRDGIIKSGGGGRVGVMRKKKQNSILRARAILCPVVSKHFYNVRTTLDVDPSMVRHDASFMGFRPTVSKRFPDAVPMRYRCLSIGKGCGNDVELERFGFCNFISGKHAVIFYDECTKHYELINYSEYGTQVNNVLYSCNFSDKGEKGVGGGGGGGGGSGGGNGKKNEGNVVLTVREILDRKRRNNGGGNVGGGSSLPRMSAVDGGGGELLECQCSTMPVSLVQAASGGGSGVGMGVGSGGGMDGMEGECGGSVSGGGSGVSGGGSGGGGSGALSVASGWEGAAVLVHGALLRFGCVTFVFSIVECATV